jgi:hypothetical protein
MLYYLILIHNWLVRPVEAAAGLLAQVSPSPSPTPSPSATPSPTPFPSGPIISIQKDPTFKIGDLGTLIGGAAAFLLIVGAILTFIMLVVGGLQWITSGGDKAHLESARNRITNAIVGLIIVAAAWGIMLLVQQFLGISLFGGVQQLPRAF